MALWTLVAVAGWSLSGEDVARMTASIRPGSVPLLSRQEEAALIARSEVDSPSAARRRAFIPVFCSMSPMAFSGNWASPLLGTMQSGR
jgi:hypothetical protein